ncbi:hypothetical protein QR680_015122 [Steinernema hermaphroditum]|uniref:Uncharacterized protein n=1 Tax=Steinernema hermaphroditum TaxID=289476 RepID=A0AA39IB90_9BILA|nr:hypothetical protein QR680_015122 [Steinernema hermaphroditum]
MWPNFVIFFLFAAFSLHVGSTSQSRNLTSQDLLYAIRNGTHWFNIAVSGETDIFPPFDVFKNLAQALYQFPSTERNREENEEYRKLRCAMLKLSKAINSSYEFVGSFMNKKWLDYATKDMNRFRFVIFRHLVKAPRTRLRRTRILKDIVLFRGRAGVFIDVYASMSDETDAINIKWFLSRMHDAEEFHRRSHYSLAAYTKFEALILRLYFEASFMLHLRLIYGADGRTIIWPKDLAKVQESIAVINSTLTDGRKQQMVGWWKKGIIAGAQKFLSAAEFRDSAKQDAALCLKNHLEENYGYSYWPQKEVHRFGVVIFSDSFAYTPGIEEELSVALFWWEEQSAYVLIYKSTFGEETYHENKQFHAEHIREIEDRFHNISTTGSCFQLFDYTAPVANALLPVLNSAKSLNNKLYYFWLSTDKLKDTDWINAVDVGVAGSPVQSFNASAVATFEAELHVSYCFGLKTAKLPVLVFVGY